MHGIGGTVAYTGIATAQNLLVGGSVGDEFNVAELRDGLNNVVGAFASGRKRTCTFEIYIKGSSEANAKAIVQLPEPLATVTISGFSVGTGTTPNLLDGDWNYVGGGSVAMSTDGYWKVTLPCARWAQSDGAVPTALA